MYASMPLLFSFLFFLSFSLKSQSEGDIDNTFSVGSAFNNFAYDVVLQSDGKVVVAGSFTNYNGTTRERVIRLNSDGSVDTGFNTSSAFDNAAWCLAIDGNGKIVVGGTFTNYSSVTRGRIARLNTNGSLDNTFVPTGTGFNDVVYAIVIDGDGKIVAVGDFTTFNGTSRRKIARLNSDGTLDTGFNPGDGFNGRCEAVAIDGDGKIVVGGDFTSYNSVTRRRIARINPNGTLDTGFSPTGTSFNDFVYDLFILPDGKILVAGAFTNYNGTTRNRLARLNSDGTLDTGFAPAGTGFNNDVWGIKLLSDEKILAVGNFTSFNGTTRNRILRLNADGTLDNTFNVGTGLNDKAHDLVVQSDGKVIVVGEFTQYQGNSRSRITRIWGSSGPLPVILAYFQALPQKNGIFLQWKTTQEVNHSHFEVEHAQD
ncbi:MAG: hypothetical protein NZ521_07795, partial [Flammeovirgaceae bacterium]|nr:hypothetical protein [Flammeovirgaceae bacterium]MDW8288114.1 hypothetical protein [Flammeovirgaceae bacterium]